LFRLDASIRVARAVPHLTPQASRSTPALPRQAARPPAAPELTATTPHR